MPCRHGGDRCTIEESANPHAELDHELREDLTDEMVIAEAKKQKQVVGKIYNRDLERYGYTDGCERCDDLKHGKANFSRTTRMSAA